MLSQVSFTRRLTVSGTLADLRIGALEHLRAFVAGAPASKSCRGPPPPRLIATWELPTLPPSVKRRPSFDSGRAFNRSRTGSPPSPCIAGTWRSNAYKLRGRLSQSLAGRLWEGRLAFSSSTSPAARRRVRSAAPLCAVTPCPMSLGSRCPSCEPASVSLAEGPAAQDGRHGLRARGLDPSPRNALFQPPRIHTGPFPSPRWEVFGKAVPVSL